MNIEALIRFETDNRFLETRAKLEVGQRAAFGGLWQNFTATWIQRKDGPEYAEMIIFGGRAHAPVPWCGALKAGATEAFLEQWTDFLARYGIIEGVRTDEARGEPPMFETETQGADVAEQSTMEVATAETIEDEPDAGENRV